MNEFMKKIKIDSKKLQLNKLRIAPLTTTQLEIVKGGNLTNTIQNGGTSLAGDGACTGR
jgi:hypothetical protein